jgi:hypothetical protein
MRPVRPKKTYTKKRLPSKDSIRVKIGQSAHFWTLAELRRMLHEAADRLEAAGVTHVRSCSLYVPPVNDKGQPVTVINSQPLQDLLVVEPYRSAADEHGL